jgi:trypsin-like peptidase/tetratricopeptide repeat protein
MSWDDAAQYESKLNRALDQFNWPKAKEICQEILGRIKTEPDLMPDVSANRLMYALRRKRRFDLMTQLAESLLQSGLRTQQVRRQYAQALIDQGVLAAGEMVLHSIIQEPQGIKNEALEARGLTGRIYKQLYVNNNDPKSLRNRANLERALNEYDFVYRLDPQNNVWHGINVVALAARAQRDRLPLSGLPDAPAMAQDILATLKQREADATQPLRAWDYATAMEAHVALGNDKEAAEAAIRYTDSIDVDAFEISSTIRQLTETWQLNDQEAPGNFLLPICRAGHLRKEGAAEIGHPRAMAEEAHAAGEAVKGLEAIFGPDGMSTLKWYKKGLEQCNSVARVEKRNGKGHGTGWLVNASDFFNGAEGVLLLTNNHVVSQSPNPYAILPNDCKINFQAIGELFDVEDDIRWSSSYLELDATFLKLKGVPKATPLTLHKRAMEMADPPPRMYIIGHPRGRDLELSLQDNHLVGCNDTLLHYRTPTEPGSSGSPVFEPEDWRVVGLHHKAHEQMKRIDGKEGTYEANEGISILALQKKTKNH